MTGAFKIFHTKTSSKFTDLWTGNVMYVDSEDVWFESWEIHQPFWLQMA